jgi:hypothetical protein
MSLSTNTTYRVLLEKLGGSNPNTFIGDEGELFYNPSATTLKISNGSTPGGVAVAGGGTNYWNKTAAGIHTLSNVGLGTTNPQTKLEINGVLGFTPFEPGSEGNIKIGDNTTGSNVGAGGSPANSSNVFIGIGAGSGLSGILDYYSISITSSTTILGQANQSYTGLAATTSGSGTEALFSVYRDASGVIYSVSPYPGGKNYQVGDVITINGSLVGGVNGTDNVTCTIVSVVGSTSSNNNFLGYQAGYKISNASNNNFLGYQAGYEIISGTGNNFLGEFAGKLTTIGSNNNFFGANAGRDNTTGSDNNFLGYQAGIANTTGFYNNFFGSYAGNANTTGFYNNFLGQVAGGQNITGSSNNFLGQVAGGSNITGSKNNFLGESSGFYNTTGNNNTFLGSYSGISTTASRKIILGSGYNYLNYFDSPNTDKDIQFAVGVRTDANPSKYWLVGNENFNVGIGTTNPTSKLEVQSGDIRVGVNTSQGLILTSPNGTKFRLIVNNSGALSTVLVP